MPTELFSLLVLVGTVVVLAAFWFLGMGGRLFLSAPLWFWVLQSLNYFGTLGVAHFADPTDREWIAVCLASMLAFTFGVWGANAAFGFRPGREVRAFVARPMEFDLQGTKWGLLLAASVACLAVGIIFAIAVGYNVYADSATEYLASGGRVDAEAYSMRRVAISTDRYVAVGHAVQFTSILLPMILYLGYFRVRVSERFVEAAWLALFALADLYFLTITGGRVWLIYAALGFMMLTSSFGPISRSERRGATRWAAWAVAGVLGLFYLTATLLMGRAQIGGGSASEVRNGMASEVFDRLMGFQAEGELMLMRHFLRVEPVWGAEWWDGMRRAVPGLASPHGFGSELHAMLFNGDNSGSLGLTTWGSCMYNWGMIGTLIVAVVLGAALQAFTITYFRGPKTLVRTIILFIAGIRLAGFRDVYSLLLEGFPTTVLFYGILQWLSRPSGARRGILVPSGALK